MEKKEYIVLDTNIIIIDPLVLGIESKKYELVITKSVLAELSLKSHVNSKFREILDLTRESIKRGIVKYIDIGEMPSSFKIETDMYINIIKRIEQSEKVKVYLATEDKLFSNVYKSAGIRLLRLSELKILLNNDHSVTTELFNDANKFKLKRNQDLIIGSAIGSIISTLVLIFFDNFDEILNKVNVWGTVLILFIGIFVVYWTRCHKRLGYGVLECIIGTYMALRLFIPDFDYTNFSFDSTVLIQILAGVFAIIRGLDNIGKGLSGTKLGITWQKVFPQ
jgi:rRNA-processing protein FCF1/uncharacterized membrane protein